MELLVVIAIIAILAAVVVLIINPLELTRRSRDARRLTDLTNLQNAINVAVQEATNSGEDILCSGAGYPCGGLAGDGRSGGTSGNGTRAADGSGWVKVNLSTSQSVSVPTLPADPVNDDTYHYTYCADNDAWEINTVLESVQQRDLMANDGGPDNADNATDSTGRYEVGSNLGLILSTGGVCDY